MPSNLHTTLLDPLANHARPIEHWRSPRLFKSGTLLANQATAHISARCIR